MTQNRIWASVLVLAFSSALVAAAAHADTYSVQVLRLTDAGVFVKANDYGDYVIADGHIEPGSGSGCPLSADRCYLVHLDGSTYLSETVPTLRDDLDPTSGPGCISTPADFSGTEVCNDGHQFFSGSLIPYDYSELYAGTEFSDVIDRGDIRLQSAILTPDGSLYYENFSNDTLDVALDLNTSPTPEPSTFALLGTGLLGIGGMLKPCLPSRSRCWQKDRGVSKTGASGAAAENEEPA